MEMLILKQLAERLGATYIEDEGWKFSNIRDLTLFIGIATRMKYVKISENYFLMSVNLTSVISDVIAEGSRNDETQILNGLPFASKFLHPRPTLQPRVDGKK